MGLTMKKILDRFDECNKFSLTGPIERYNSTITVGKYSITEEDFYKALNKIKKQDKENLNNIYNDNKDKLKNYPDFEILYKEIEQECYEFDNDTNREYYKNKFFPKEKIQKLKQLGYSDNMIEKKKKKKNFFKYAFITDNVGKTTKYGSEYKNFFYNFYSKISTNIDRENLKDEFCIGDIQDPVEQIPFELKQHLLYYEISFYNEVTISSGPMINYYFKLNEETKKYLLKFRNDFELDFLLDDLAIYKDNEVKFYSCTHEGFNSLKFDYNNMTKEDIIDFINDEYPNNANNQIISIIFKLINMDVNTTFSFKGIGIEEQEYKNIICNICSKIGIKLVSKDKQDHGWATINGNGNFEKVQELPAILCNIDDIIEKKQ